MSSHNFGPIVPVGIKILKAPFIVNGSHFQAFDDYVGMVLSGFIHREAWSLSRKLYLNDIAYGGSFFIDQWNEGEVSRINEFFQIECELAPSFVLDHKRIEHDEETKKLHIEIERLVKTTELLSSENEQLFKEREQIDLQKYLGNPKEVLLKW